MHKDDVARAKKRRMLSCKRRWNHVISSKRPGPGDPHTQWANADRGRKIPCGIPSVWNLKTDTKQRHGKTEPAPQSWTDKPVFQKSKQPCRVKLRHFNWHTHPHRCYASFINWTESTVKDPSYTLYYPRWTEKSKNKRHLCICSIQQTCTLYINATFKIE